RLTFCCSIHAVKSRVAISFPHIGFLPVPGRRAPGGYEPEQSCMVAIVWIARKAEWEVWSLS
ncbi:MAG: hypothetical protein ABSC37_21755, partial [Xanthobacteraceae bacterium]